MLRLGNRGSPSSFIALILAMVTMYACSSTPRAEHEAGTGMLTLPELAAADLGGAPLGVVATTSIVGDVVAQVGGDAIELTTLMGPGQDPHSYEPAARDLTAVSQAHVLFVNGWDLEEALIGSLEAIGEDVPLVPVAANCEPLAFGGHKDEQEGEHGEDGDRRHESVDPHTWFSIHNVKQWVENIKHILCDLDPANAETYERNAEAYLVELEELETYVQTQLASIPAGNRFLVTNHDSFGYFVHEYDFQVLGTVIPSASSLAEPSARDVSELIQKMQDHGMCTVFTETTVSDNLAQAVAAELDGCDSVRVLKLYTGAVGPPGSGADSYLGMFRSNVDTIVDGLK
jgi:ABC-type Zn uptake system ZnuABC Zn-binding protein ZnuA